MDGGWRHGRRGLGRPDGEMEEEEEEGGGTQTARPPGHFRDAGAALSVRGGRLPSLTITCRHSQSLAVTRHHRQFTQQALTSLGTSAIAYARCGPAGTPLPSVCRESRYVIYVQVR